MSVRAELAAAKEEVREDPRWLRTWFWPAWLTVLAVSFAVAETWALVHPGRGGTMSERKREWLGIHGKDKDIRVGWAVMTVALAVFAVWYPVHLMEWWPWER